MFGSHTIASYSKLLLPWMTKTVMRRRVNDMLAKITSYRHIRPYQS